MWIQRIGINGLRSHTGLVLNFNTSFSKWLFQFVYLQVEYEKSQWLYINTNYFSFYFFNFFFSAIQEHTDFLGQGSDSSHTCDCGCASVESFNSLCQVGNWICVPVLQRCCPFCCATAGNPLFHFSNGSLSGEHVLIFVILLLINLCLIQKS